MANRKQARLTEIQQYLRQASVAVVGESDFAALSERLKPIGGDALRKLLRESGAPLSPAVEGVRQASFEELERTLSALTAEYSRSHHTRARALRRLVIAAKDHARFAARAARDEQKKRDKEEMAQWMLVWLENPPLFPQWARLRGVRRRLYDGSP